MHCCCRCFPLIYFHSHSRWVRAYSPLWFITTVNWITQDNSHAAAAVAAAVRLTSTQSTHNKDANQAFFLLNIVVFAQLMHYIWSAPWQIQMRLHFWSLLTFPTIIAYYTWQHLFWIPRCFFFSLLFMRSVLIPTHNAAQWMGICWFALRNQRTHANCIRNQQHFSFQSTSQLEALKQRNRLLSDWLRAKDLIARSFNCQHHVPKAHCKDATGMYLYSASNSTQIIIGTV